MNKTKNKIRAIHKKTTEANNKTKPNNGKTYLANIDEEQSQGNPWQRQHFLVEQ